MNEKRSQTKRLHTRTLGVIGAGAFIGLGTLAVVTGPSDGGGTIAVAGSGDAATNTVYVQPSASIMTVGATATWTTPTSVEPLPKAVPQLKGQ